jgi:ABC-type nitrate/sulfonate/bicarbonate transport system substrate-binding protein
MGPFFAAQEYGWYSKQGLKVSLNYGAESTNPVAMVLSGSDQIGVLGGPDTVLVAVGKGAPLVIVAIMHKDSNMPCVITKRDSGITNVAQLADKRVGMFKGHISTDVLRNWFRRTGVKVTEVDVGYDYSQFLNSQIDAQWAFTTAAAVELEEKGIPVNVLNPSVDGIYTHGFTIFTTKDFLAAHPDRVRGFLAATFEGITKMHDSPDEISKLVTSRDTTGNLQVDQVRRRIDQYNTFSPSFNPLPPGYFNKKMISDTYDRLLEEGVIEKPFPVENAYTTKFLAEIHGEKYTP